MFCTRVKYVWGLWINHAGYQAGKLQMTSSAWKHVHKNFIRTYTLSRQCTNYWTKLPRQPWDRTSIISKCKPFVLTLSFASPLEFMRRHLSHGNHSNNNHTMSPEVMSKIPKEVFQKERKKKKRKRNIIVRILIAIWRGLRLTLRVVSLTFTFMPLVSLYPLTYLSTRFKGIWWRMLLFATEISGPTFIKLGQWAGTRRDLFPAEFCDLFSKLHFCTRQHSWYITRRKLTEAFGKKWPEIFVKFEKKPVGSGCIAQVHKAYMRVDMIPDEDLVEEVMLELSEDDEDQQDIDFAEGMEIVGFGRMMDTKEHVEEVIEKKRKGKQGKDTGLPTDPRVKEDNQSKTTFVGDQTPASEKHGEDVTKSHDCSDQCLEDDEQLLPVAVKVVHPGIHNSVARDLAILRGSAWLLETILPGLKWLSLGECVREFSDMMVRQIDLRYEAECLDQFVDNFLEVPNVRFPRPLWPYCKRDVMVETWEEGEHISNFINEDRETPEGLKEKLASFGADALLQMVFVDNFVHGDLHPGNILVQNADLYVPQEENKVMLVDICDTVIVNVKPVDDPVRLVMLDAGIVSCLGDQDLKNFRDVFTAVVVGEGEKVGELVLKHSRYHECTDVTAFKKEIAAIIKQFRQVTLRLGKVQAGDLLSTFFKVLIKHRVKMESNFASIMLAIFVLEGLGRSLDPDMDLMEKAKPVLLHK